MPFFLITIDTEGDNAWAKPQTITTRNAEFLPRFQSLCERYGLKPTYLTNYEMATCPAFQEFGNDRQQRGRAEIGMHLHAWNSPPTTPLTPDDYRHQPYLLEYPARVMRDKIAFMTDLLTTTFNQRPVSHRAGRWGFNAPYARLLAEAGYLVDCSVTPYISWRNHTGNPNGNGGPNFATFPTRAYWLDLDAIHRSGNSTVLEVPATIIPAGMPFTKTAHALVGEAPQICRRVVHRLFPLWWLYPDTDGRNRRGMLQILKQATTGQWDYVEFVLHSSELMPGGSPHFPTPESIEALYAHLESLFAAAQPDFQGATLSDYYRHFQPAPAPDPPQPAAPPRRQLSAAAPEG